MRTRRILRAVAVVLLTVVAIALVGAALELGDYTNPGLARGLLWTAGVAAVLAILLYVVSFWPWSSTRDRLAEFPLEGELLMKSIYEDEDETHHSQWWRSITDWKSKTALWLMKKQSRADAILFSASITVDGTRQHKYKDRVLSLEKEKAVQHMEQFLARLGEIMRRVED